MTDEEDRAEEAAPEHIVGAQSRGLGTPLPEDMEGLRRLVEEERAKAEDRWNQLLRARADYANLKRRTDQEKAEAARFGNAMLILNLLPILDDFERALDSVSAKLAGFTWVDGVAMIYRKYKATLEVNGLSEIKAVGEKFDPSLHEAIQFVEGEEGKVLEEVQKGYKLFDRVIRPALVKVGGKPPESAPPDKVAESDASARTGPSGESASVPVDKGDTDPL